MRFMIVFLFLLFTIPVAFRDESGRHGGRSYRACTGLDDLHQVPHVLQEVFHSGKS
jgi:hypothetical protein